MTEAPWLAGIPRRALLDRDVEARFPLPPGDRPLVEAEHVVAAGDPLLEHLRDRRIEEVVVRAPEGERGPAPGSRWSLAPGRRRSGERLDGELLCQVPGRRDTWRLVTGEHRDVIASPLPGTVVEVRPGAEIRVRAAGPALRGAFAAGSASYGRLELATDASGELQPGGIGVARAGSILVVGARIDAEALTRARAMGVRGIVVASLPGKELRDFQASERRQRAALTPGSPFGVLALEGALRRPIPSAVIALLEACAGQEVALLVDPPALVFAADVALPDVAPDHVRVRTGANIGTEGQVIGPAGLRRFASGVLLEAAWVSFDGESPVDVPLGDLERYG